MSRAIALRYPLVGPIRVSLRSLVASAALTLAPLTMQAQGGAAGNWRVEFPRRVENDGSGDRVTEFGHALVILQLKGDSVVGTWKTTDGGPGPSMQRSVAGTISGNKLHLVSEPFEAVMRGPDGESKVKLIVSYDLEITGDTLAGTQQAKPQDGGPEGPSLPVKGTREKA